MGGDGGVVAVNRRYMRGAGTADHTGDASKGNQAAVDPAILHEQLLRDFKTCAVSNQPLDYNRPIVVCPYGRLYDKEAALEAMIKKHELLKHIRSLKDLLPVRFHLINHLPACPVTEKALNGHIPAFVVLPGQPSLPNVISERGLEMKDIAVDYEPIDWTIRLMPPGSELKRIQDAWIAKQQKDVSSKKRKLRENKIKKNKPRTSDIEGEVSVVPVTTEASASTPRNEDNL